METDLAAAEAAVEDSEKDPETVVVVALLA